MYTVLMSGITVWVREPFSHVCPGASRHEFVTGSDGALW